ncbi:MAG: exonuclease SbcCD subunit D [Actinomycetota bacterium]|nr:exonuclease SbcCD subunit D [Actinomycetota bacterium]
MRILHTGDWHIGKKLGRIDRVDEAEAVLDEVVGIAADEDVDAVLVAGDLFDRAAPPLPYLSLVLDTLMRLASDGRRVVVIPGNHDSPELMRVLGPLLSGFGVSVVHKPLAPEDGGVVVVPARDGATAARVACLPFVHEAQVIDVMDVPEEGYKSYADRIRHLTSHYARWMVAHHDPKAADLLMGHFMVHGAVPSGTERELHIGEAYMATAEAIPPEIKYAALGHIHQAQDAPGSAVPARYCGSLLQLDFGEAGQGKSVCIVDVAPGMRPAQTKCVPLTAGRTLMRVAGTLDEITARAAEYGDAILDVSVTTEGPAPGLADEVRALLPNALYVRAAWEREAVAAASREGKSLPELYGDYYEERHAVPPSAELMHAFEDLLDRVGVEL